MSEYEQQYPPQQYPPPHPPYVQPYAQPYGPPQPYAAPPQHFGPPAPPPRPRDMRPRRRPVVFALSLIVSLAVVAAGVVVAVRAYTRTSTPEVAVRGYFAALARGDAPAALAYGDLPSGSRTLLNSAALQLQQRTAPLSDVTIDSGSRDGRRAKITVTYRLGFAEHRQSVTGDISLHRSGRGWRLDTAAVRTELVVNSASARASAAGRGVPKGAVLVFPGAAPVGFDTPLLELNPIGGQVAFGAPARTLLYAQLSTAGRAAVLAAVRNSLDLCYAPDASPALRCPLPDERYVPGALSGKVTDSLTKDVSIVVEQDPTGALTISGQVRVVGTSVRLGFDNSLQTKTGTVVVPVRGSAYPVSPVRVVWERST